MEQLYDIYFAGQLEDGFDEATVRSNLGTLFKANDATMDKLFSGKPQSIKKGVEKSAAIKYKAAMQKAGAKALIRAHADSASATKAPSAAAAAIPAAIPATTPAAIPTTTPAAAPISMADRIAALAGEDPAAASPPAPETTAPAPAEDGSISLAPAGSDVLREDERPVIEELDIDTSAIHLESSFIEPEAIPGEPPPPAPDTSHLSMGEVGEDIPHLETQVEPVNPDISNLSMAEVGEDIPTLQIQQELVDPDISGLSLAPAGSDVLEPEYRRKHDAQAPDTDHIKLEESPGAA